jgi:LDH2 family malate/lactate/ureidoglycolate dehydrogenase
MGHFFAAVRIDAFQPLESFRAAMDAMIDALHAAPPSDPDGKLCYPGEIEDATAAERAQNGVPISDYLYRELQALAKQFGVEPPPIEARSS